MTATFGKLEHETLCFQPGLNIITARNEWGKSTWCAFLAAMLYGIDTRAKTTRTALADKERYAPWSGSPMSGRIDLNWNGQDITIERSTRGRIPLGEFRAYETRSGLPIPEITAENCGQMLLGVERSVFLRSAFIRFSDLNVSDDEAFRRRLNNLVTAGDEDGSAQRLAGELKQLRNRIRHHRTGLLPTAEAERDTLEARCREWQALASGQEDIIRRMDEAEDWRMALENHMDALEYAQTRESLEKILQAEQARDAALQEYETLTGHCDTLPQRETAAEMLEQLQHLEQERTLLQNQLRATLEAERSGALPDQFSGMSAEEALATADRDAARYVRCRTPRYGMLLPGGILAAVGAVVGLSDPAAGLLWGGIGVACLLIALGLLLFCRRTRLRLEKHYASPDPRLWIQLAREYANKVWQGACDAQLLLHNRRELEKQLKSCNGQIRQITRGLELEPGRSEWEDILAAWDAKENALREYRRCQEHLDALNSVVRPQKAPEFPDRLEHSAAETVHLLDVCREEQKLLENLRGRNQARMEALGSMEELKQELTRINARIAELEQRYDALGIALDALEEAAQTLQRRFSPRITQQAQDLMSQMTGGRYDRLQLSRELTIQAGAGQEDVLHEALWRSDGTVDQLYLALRLALARELIPASPLVLDDALVRFDDERLKAALDILKEESQSRQVILFTCQNRESALIN